MEALFGTGFWDHVTLGVSFWKYTEDSINQRNHSGKTESWWIEEKNKQIQARFHIEKDLDAVFIDSWSQQTWNLEDQLQQIAFQRETKKLWDLFSAMDSFEFKTIQDVIEELQECNQLLDGSIEQLQKDMEDRVAEINLLNEDVRNFGIIAAKNRHNILVNGDMIQKNVEKIEENFELNSGLIQTIKDDVEVNSGIIQCNKDDIGVNSGLIQTNKEKADANKNSINVSHNFSNSIHGKPGDF